MKTKEEIESEIKEIEKCLNSELFHHSHKQLMEAQLKTLKWVLDLDSEQPKTKRPPIKWF